MEYMLLIYSNELPENEVKPAERARMFKVYGEFGAELRDSGQMEHSSSRNRRWHSGWFVRRRRSAWRVFRSACRPTTCSPSG